MKYGKHLETKKNLEWAQYYIDYSGLKDIIKSAQEQASKSGGDVAAFSPRTTSLSVQRYNQNKGGGAAEMFFTKLEQDVAKVNKFTTHLVTELRSGLKNLQSKYDRDPSNKDPMHVAKLQQEAQAIGDKFLALEKFVNLNYMGFHKILKKHDKCLPHAPCRQFYIAHLHQQPWVQGNFSDLLVSLSNIHSLLRGDSAGTQNDDAAQGFVRSTTKYWVRPEDVSAVKHHILQQLPVFQHDKENFAGDAQLINSVYLDNSSMELYQGRLDKTPGAIAVRVRWYGNVPPKTVFMERKTHREGWKGEESVKERFLLPEEKVAAFLDGDYSLEQALSDMEKSYQKKGKTLSEAERVAYRTLFLEVYQAVDSKQLRPLMRTQYMRTAFQIPFDSSVRISLDTNLCMIKENPEDGPTCAATGRWYRDPELPIHRTEITRFPHAVLEVKLSLQEGQESPPWLQDMIHSGYLSEIHKFSKFIHGCATIFPDLIRAVPYWVDDESVRPSMLASAPSPTLPGALSEEEGDIESPGPSSALLAKPRRAPATQP
ncbi:MAG: hypothetical protein WDW38_007846 [Sanguina aurantia]